MSYQLFIPGFSSLKNQKSMSGVTVIILEMDLNSIGQYHNFDKFLFFFRVFKCHVCDKESVRRYGIVNHIASAHGECTALLII